MADESQLVAAPMADRLRKAAAAVPPYIVMAYAVMAYMVVDYKAMAYIVMAFINMACIIMVYTARMLGWYV